MAFTDNDQKAVDEGIISPTHQERFNERWTTWRPIKELIQAAGYIAAMRQRAEGTRRRQIRISTNKGL